MKTWRAYFQINGYEFSRFPVVDFDVSDELYEKITAAIDQLIPLPDCDFYQELLSLADNALNLDDYAIGSDERPDPSDFDDEEEYNEALDEWMDEYGELNDSMGVESCIIDDPGDLKRLVAQFRGKVFPEWAGNDTVELEYEDYYGVTYFYLTVHVDEKGTVLDITDVSGSSLESEDVKSSSWGESYPDYDYIAEKLQEDFESQSDEE